MDYPKYSKESFVSRVGIVPIVATTVLFAFFVWVLAQGTPDRAPHPASAAWHNDHPRSESPIIRRSP